MTREESNKYRRPVQSKEGSCIIFCRKATNISQKKIKEDVSKHQRKACCAALESFRVNEPEIVNEWEISPLFLSLCFGKQALLLLASSVLPRREGCSL